jgi:hypothetical protein
MAGRGTQATAVDFNNIRTIVDNVYGIGSGQSGYGQTLLSTSAVAGGVISSTLWNNLRTDMAKARVHQTNIPVDDGTANNGQTLKVITSSTTVTEALRFQFATFANQLNTDRNLVAPQQTTSGVALDSQQRTTSWGYEPGNFEVRYQLALSFNGYGSVSGENHIRNFFNAGGSIDINASRSGGTSHPKNNDWSLLLSQFGIFSFKSTSCSVTGTINSPGSVATSQGLYTLPVGGEFVTLFTQASSNSLYSVNRYTIEARRPGLSGLIFRITFADFDLDGAVADQVGGTLSSIVTCTRATGSNVAVPAPTAERIGGNF